jgi:hypothetical protein
MARAVAQELSFRPISAGDAAFAADVDTAVRPHGPRDPRASTGGRSRTRTG